MAGYAVKAAAVAARVAGMDRYFERGAVLPEGVENLEHLLAVGLVAEVVEITAPDEVIAPKSTANKKN